MNLPLLGYRAKLKLNSDNDPFDTFIFSGLIFIAVIFIVLLGFYFILITSLSALPFEYAVNGDSITLTSWKDKNNPNIKEAVIPDNVEGLKDSDNDGIVDYLDAIDECNVLPSKFSIAQYLADPECIE